MSELIPITKVPGGELGMHMVSNGIESVRNAIAYDNRLQQLSWEGYNSWYTQSLQSMVTSIDEQTLYNTQQLLQEATSVRGDDWIYPATTIEELRQTPYSRMAYYILANPKVTEAVKAGLMDGYGMDYVTQDKHTDNYYDVVSGIRMEEFSQTMEGFDEPIKTARVRIEGMNMLSIGEITDILDTWDTAEKYVEKGIDFTAISGE